MSVYALQVSSAQCAERQPVSSAPPVAGTLDFSEPLCTKQRTQLAPADEQCMATQNVWKILVCTCVTVSLRACSLCTRQVIAKDAVRKDKSKVAVPKDKSKPTANVRSAQL